MKKLLTIILAMTMCVVVASAQSADDNYTKGKAFYDAEQYDKAVPLLRKAADKGHKKAQYRLGRCYDKGYGVPKDKKEAFRYYMKAAEQSYAKAEYRVAKAYVKGKAVAADEKKARQYIKRAVAGKKHGQEILKEIRDDAAAGDDDAKKLLQLLK